jgi:hypothetical protein
MCVLMGLGASFWRDVLYCNRDGGWAGLARSEVVASVVQSRTGIATNVQPIGLPVTGDTV